MGDKTQTLQQRKELLLLAYQAVTLVAPTEEILDLLASVGMKRALEILLVMRQSPAQIKNHTAFIKAAVIKGWTPDSLPVKKSRKIAKVPSPDSENSNTGFNSSVPLYNWLED